MNENNLAEPFFKIEKFENHVELIIGHYPTSRKQALYIRQHFTVNDYKNITTALRYARAALAEIQANEVYQLYKKRKVLGRSTTGFLYVNASAGYTSEGTRYARIMYTRRGDSKRTVISATKQGAWSAYVTACRIASKQQKIKITIKQMREQYENVFLPFWRERFESVGVDCAVYDWSNE